MRHELHELARRETDKANRRRAEMTRLQNLANQARRMRRESVVAAVEKQLRRLELIGRP